MKKAITLLLCTIMVLTLAACAVGTPGESTTPSTTEADMPALQVGYGRVDMTPSVPVSLYGFGTHDERKHNNVLDPIYATCVAVTDAEGNTLLFLTADVIVVQSGVAGGLRNQAAKAAGVPVENVSFTGTHSHSTMMANAIVYDPMLEAVEIAMENRKPAEMYIGSGNTVGLNFVRHYTTDVDDIMVGDNHGRLRGGNYTGHATDADTQMQIIRFVREDDKEVVMVNWQAHPTLTGGNMATDLSADFVGAFRMHLEKMYDCNFAYFQGAAGNLNPSSRISSENAFKGYMDHGKKLAEAATDVLKGEMTKVEPGLIQVSSQRYSGAPNRSQTHLAGTAGEVTAYYAAGHSIEETRVYAEQLGLWSLYHAKAILSAPTDPIEFTISTACIGDVGFAFAPYEMFDTNAMFIKENSPMDMTFVLGYTNDHVGYIPSQEAFEYGCYEADTCDFNPGVGEDLANRYVSMLTELKGE